MYEQVFSGIVTCFVKAEAVLAFAVWAENVQGFVSDVCKAHLLSAKGTCVTFSC